jgi:NAD-dependent SIR2 family protein deacetylase
MRFFADGPNIPERLLEDRDNGNVVFFCGAGVSQPAGLPGFARLAEEVVEELGRPQMQRRA